MTKGQAIVLIAVVALAIWFWRDAQAARTKAVEHAQAVDRANKMVGIAGTVVSYLAA